MKRTRCMQVNRDYEMRQYREFRPAASSTAISEIAASSLARVGRRRRAPPSAPSEPVAVTDAKLEDEHLDEENVLPLGSEQQTAAVDGANGAPSFPITVVQYGDETVRVLEVFGVAVVRRESDGRINATRLLKAAAISRAQARHALLDLRRRSSAKRVVVNSRHVVMRGAWFPPEECRIYERLHRNEVIQELICEGISVMRRKSDGHVNANHILRLAGVSQVQAQRAMRDLAFRSKAKPLIVRDGESALKGKWFPAKESQQLAQEYKVFERLRPLFE
ncbi:hypothetical protein HDU80_004561 [Chytriomyces hyalinus]|nr:hypothetical protein HDU80_004561 [Chytriomyces hyalinus]